MQGDPHAQFGGGVTADLEVTAAGHDVHGQVSNLARVLNLPPLGVVWYETEIHLYCHVCVVMIVAHAVHYSRYSETKMFK